MRKRVEQIRDGLAAVSELLFPSLCSGCLSPVSPDSLVCSDCLLAIKRFPEPFCVGCLKTGWEGRGCPHCGGTIPLLALGDYCAPLKEIIVQAKFHGVIAPLYILADETAKLHSHHLSSCNASWLLPIPLHPRREIERGYNQSALIAEGLEKSAGLPVTTGPLIRTHYRKPQAKLNERDREKNIAGAFALGDSSLSDTATSFILVDDVVTTGATAREAARTLSQGGFRVAAVVALAHGE